MNIHILQYKLYKNIQKWDHGFLFHEKQAGICMSFGVGNKEQVVKQMLYGLNHCAKPLHGTAGEWD